MKNAETGLSAKQEAAIEGILEGLNVKVAAARVGVSRQTLSSWLNQNHDFQRALESRRGEAFHANVVRLRNLSAQAVDVLQSALSGEEKLSLSQIRTAEAVLRLCGVARVRIPLDGFDLSDLERGRSMRTAFDSIGEMLRRENAERELLAISCNASPEA